MRLPSWLRTHRRVGETFLKVHGLLRRNRLDTVCRSAACPNRTECWSAGTATFLLLGPVCTRRCGFCSIPKGEPAGVDHDEPERIAATAGRMRLSYVVLTSVTRDDLPDGGAGHFQRTIEAVRRASPGCRVEVLIPDLQGSAKALDTVLSALPDVLNHNMETVPSLYERVRPQADYQRSLELLSRAKHLGFRTKSGIMLGLGEQGSEVRTVLQDLRMSGCDILTIGQYLQPSRTMLPVQRYVHPDEFVVLRREALAMGFQSVVAGPLARSSYHAEETAGPRMGQGEQ
ncbi:MAG TPA: lipoyl synthase [Nitrospirota bacterium]|nr:lipoyl synthase [Nitrospirota bacterium]